MSTTESAPAHLLLPQLPFPPLDLFDKERTVSYALAKDPTLAPGRVARKLFPKPWFGARLVSRTVIKHDLKHVSWDGQGEEWTGIVGEGTGALGY